MKVFVVLEFGKPYSVHWTREGADSAAITNVSLRQRRDVFELDLKIEERDGSYFAAIAKLTEMATLGLQLAQTLRNGRGDTFEHMAVANGICTQLEKLKREFVL